MKKKRRRSARKKLVSQGQTLKKKKSRARHLKNKKRSSEYFALNVHTQHRMVYLLVILMSLEHSYKIAKKSQFLFYVRYTMLSPSYIICQKGTAVRNILMNKSIQGHKHCYFAKLAHKCPETQVFANGNQHHFNLNETDES